MRVYSTARPNAQQLCNRLVLANQVPAHEEAAERLKAHSATVDGEAVVIGRRGRNVTQM